MAIQYANLENLLADFFPELQTNEEKDAVERCLNGASAFVDSYTKRPPGYYLPASIIPFTIRVRGENKRFLRLPVHVPNTARVEGFDFENFYETSNGWLYFDNSELADIQDGLESFDNYRNFQHGKLYQVSAMWGFESTPSEIVEAVRQITVKWYQTQRGVFGTENITPTGFVVERDIPLSARAILETYRKREFEVSSPIRTSNADTASDYWNIPLMNSVGVAYSFDADFTCSMAQGGFAVYKKQFLVAGDSITVIVPASSGGGATFAIIQDANYYATFVNFNPSDAGQSVTVIYLGAKKYSVTLANGEPDIIDMSIQEITDCFLAVWALSESFVVPRPTVFA